MSLPILNWQGGYADFSVSQSNLKQVKIYIANQEKHHRRRSFQDEVRGLLTKHQMNWDERYIWDSTALRLDSRFSSSTQRSLRQRWVGGRNRFAVKEVLASTTFGALFCRSRKRRQTLHFLFESFAGDWTSISYTAVSRAKHKTAISLSRRFVRSGC